MEISRIHSSHFMYVYISITGNFLDIFDIQYMALPCPFLDTGQITFCGHVLYTGKTTFHAHFLYIRRKNCYNYHIASAKVCWGKTLTNGFPP